MSMKEIVQRMFHSFFVILSAALMAMYVFILIFGQDDFIHIKDITALFVLSVATDLAYFIFYSKRELSRIQMLVRHIIHLLSVLTIILFTAIFMQWLQLDRLIEIIVFIALGVAVYAIVFAISMYQSKKLADELTQKLKVRYRE